MRVFRFFVVAVFMLACVSAHAEKASMQRMAEDALLPHIGSKDPFLRDARLAALRDDAGLKASQNPRGEGSAIVIFNEGQSIDQIVTLLKSNNFTLMAVGVKAPLGNRGVINSISIGATDLVLTDESVDVRLRNAIGLARGRMLRIAELKGGQDGEDYREMALGELHIFKIEVAGQLAHFNGLLNRSSVSAAIVDDTGVKAEDFRAYRDDYQSSRGRLHIEEKLSSVRKRKTEQNEQSNPRQ